MIHAGWLRSDQIPQRVGRISAGCLTVTEAADFAFRYTQNIQGCWSISNELHRSKFGEDNPDLQPIESPLYGTQPFEDVVTVLGPLPEWPDGTKSGWRSSATGDYFVVEPKPDPSGSEEECVPTCLRVAMSGFDLIQESDLGTPDPGMTGTSFTSLFANSRLTLWAMCRLCVG